MGVDDFQRYERRLKIERKRVDQFEESDIPHIKRFYRRHDGRLKDSTLVHYLRSLRVCANSIETPITQLDPEGFDQYVWDLRNGDVYGNVDDLSDSTVRNYQYAVKRFLTFVDETSDLDFGWVEDIELVSPSKSKISPTDMLTAEDIAQLVDACTNLRDIAFIEFLADTGCRLSMAGSLRVGDVDLDTERPTYTPNPNASGLKGAAIRPYPIIDSQGALRTYLTQTHPRPERDDVAFFHRLNVAELDPDDDGAVTGTTMRDALKVIQQRADLDKPVHPHAFRHAAITRMRREGWDRGEIESRVHWTIDTNMWDIYEHVGAEAYNKMIWKRAGVGTGDVDEDSPLRSRCSTCHEIIAPHHKHCPRCGEPTTREGRQAKDEAVDEVEDDLVVSAHEIERLVEREVNKALRTNDLRVHD